MSWRAERESEKRMTEQGEVSVVANLRPSLMAKSSAVRMEAETGSGTYWDIHSSRGRCWEAGTVGVYVEGVVVLSVQEVDENYPTLHRTVCL